jgi:hypothetical protein
VEVAVVLVVLAGAPVVQEEQHSRVGDFERE